MKSLPMDPLAVTLRLAATCLGLVCAAGPVGHAADLPDAPEATLAAIDASIRRGVDFLVADQNPNGSWGGPTRTKGLNIYAPLPGAHHAFRAGSTGLALSGILDVKDARPEVLEEMARVSRGRVIQPAQLAELVKEITALPEPRPLESRIPLWSHWGTLVALIALLGIFWTGRKLNGAF